MDEFDAHPDFLVQTVTVMTVIFFSVLFLVFAGTDNTNGLFFLVIIALPLLVFCYLFAPTGYAVSESEILVHRKIKTVRILLSAVTSIRQDPQACSLRGIRTFGVSGLFGYFGRFYSTRLGHHTMYATDRYRTVVIEADKTYVISPDDPHRFVQVVKAWLETQHQNE